MADGNPIPCRKIRSSRRKKMKAFSKTLLSLCFVLGLFSCREAKDVKSIRYRDHTISYLAKNTSDKTIVFIHGFTSSKQVWKYEWSAFQDYRVIAIDLPGNGESSKNEDFPYSPHFFADAVYEVLTAEKINNAVFVGHSMGFAVVDVFAQQHPEMVKGLCLIDGTFFEFPEEKKAQEEWIAYNRFFADSFNQEKGRTDFIQMLFRPDTPELLKTEILEESRRVSLKIAKAMVSGMETDVDYFKKRNFTVPTLAVFSPAYGLPPDYEANLRKTFTDLEYHYVPDVSHFFMLEIPARLNQLLFDFAGKVYRK
jgi:3-oxoadipate enol-lactonase